MVSKNKILVVDDLKINRRVLDGYLSSDYEVILAGDGYEALELLSEHKVDLAIVDVHMPNMTGFELSEKIRQQSDYCELPIIFVTGAALEQSNVIQGLSIGAVDYLCKPFDLKILRLKVKNFIELSIKTAALKNEILIRKESEENLLNALQRESKLREHLKLAEKMEAIGRLSSGISHDFNNLMTALTGHAELLRNKLSGDDQLSHINSILSICESGIDISDKLKVFSRNRSPRKKVFDLGKFLKELEEMCKFSIQSNVKKSFSIPTDKLLINGSSSDLQNALLNLIVNARDSIEGNGQISVSCQQLELDQLFCDEHPLFKIIPGNYACITVKDDGVGMNEDTLGKVFEPFFSTKGEGGTGMGLAMVFGTIKEHLGCISIQSSLGEGTEVLLYLPIDSSKECETTVTPTTSISFTGHNLLVIDDEEKSLDYMKILLETYGATVQSSTDSKEALRIFSNDKDGIDLVVTDYLMPEVNGDTLIEQMKEIDPNLNMIMISGISDQSKIEEFREEGISIITKPFHVQDFIEAVAKKFSPIS